MGVCARLCVSTFKRLPLYIGDFKHTTDLPTNYSQSLLSARLLSAVNKNIFVGLAQTFLGHSPGQTNVSFRVLTFKNGSTRIPRPRNKMSVI